MSLPTLPILGLWEITFISFLRGERVSLEQENVCEEVGNIKRLLISGVSCSFPLPACLSAVFQQNLQIAKVIAVIAISHHELATNSCLRFSACFCSVLWTQSYLLTLIPPSKQKNPEIFIFFLRFLCSSSPFYLCVVCCCVENTVCSLPLEKLLLKVLASLESLSTFSTALLNKKLFF